MNGWILIAIAGSAMGCFAQDFPIAPVTPIPPVTPVTPVTPFTWVMPDMNEQLGKAQKELEKMQEGFSKFQNKSAFKFDIAGTVNAISAASAGLSMFQGKGPAGGRLDGEYDAGTRALDDRRYDDAIRRFDAVIDGKSPRADGALYWKAYALNRVGRKDDALAAIAALRRDYPASHWLNDAQALEGEVKQSSGQAVSPAEETNEDLKLMAINSLMGADPERAIPLLEVILKGNSSPKVKDRALFVLTQNRSARAQQILSDYARGAGNPDLQIRAIRYIGMSGTPDAAQKLASYYAASNDVAVKRQIIQSLMISQDKNVMFNLAKTEKDDTLRSDAIRQLGVMRATDQLSQLYAAETSPENKVQIIRSLFVAGASDKLLDLIKNEKDPKVRDEAIRNYARTHSTTSETLAGFYTSASDPNAKKSVVNGLFERSDAKTLIDLERKESDPAMKSYIVQRLTTMVRSNKEAADFMIELLK